MRDAQIETRTMIEIERMFDEMERKHNLMAKRKHVKIVNTISFVLLVVIAIAIRTLV